VAAFLSQFPRVETFAEIDEILRSPDFHQGSHFESRPVYGGALVVIDGPEHRARRRALMPLFSHDSLRRNEREWLGPAIDKVFGALRATRSSDGLVHTDLVALLRGFLIGVSAGLTGVDDARQPERRARLQELVSRLEAASAVEWTTRNREEVLHERIVARRELIRDFLQPALTRRIELVKAHRAGSLVAADLPMDLLTVLAQQDAVGDQDEEATVWRECALFLVAGTQTTAHALPHVVWHLHHWWAEHPHDLARATDMEFLRAAANESLRLHQPVPALLRMATRDTTLACNGRAFRKGERVALFFTAANRDPALFGADVDRFNPQRTFARKPPPWGLTFGSGVHTCIARAMVTGLSQNYDDADPTRGTIVGLLGPLYRAGAELDPLAPPQCNTDSGHDAFSSMPVILRNL